MNEIKYLVYSTKQNPYIIIEKPHNLPSAPISSQDKNNAFSIVAEKFPQVLNVSGKKEIEHGLIHRLDTATKGLLLIAAEQNCYNFLINEQNNNKIKKTYVAICNIIPNNSTILQGFPPLPLTQIQIKENVSFEISSLFRSYGNNSTQVRPVTQNSSKIILKKVGKHKIYTTNIKVLELYDNNTVKVECTITQGFRHQVRCHLAWVGLPIVNDNIYNIEHQNNKEIKFYATKLSFEYPKNSLNEYELTNYL